MAPIIAKFFIKKVDKIAIILSILDKSLIGEASRVNKECKHSLSTFLAPDCHFIEDADRFNWLLILLYDFYLVIFLIILWKTRKYLCRFLWRFGGWFLFYLFWGFLRLRSFYQLGFFWSWCLLIIFSNLLWFCGDFSLGVKKLTFFWKQGWIRCIFSPRINLLTFLFLKLTVWKRKR